MYNKHVGGSNGRGRGMMPMFGGLPLGFNPMAYGMDPDSTIVDCLDDTNCVRGLYGFKARAMAQAAARAAQAA